jgi:hypothetical protein
MAIRKVALVFFVFLLSAANLWYPSEVHAALYAPGATLNPNCAPTDQNCGIENLVASSTADAVPYYAANGTVLSATSSITILQNGNIGIGTTSPSTLLSVAGNANLGGNLATAGTVNAASFVGSGSGLYSVPVLTASAYHAFGDSITYGYGTPPSTGYASLVAQDSDTTLTDDGIVGEEACDMDHDEIFNNENPGATSSPLYTLMIGTNEAHGQGTGAYEAVFNLCQQAAITWLTIPSEYKVFGQNSSTVLTGTWSNDNTFQTGIGIESTTNGSAASFPLTTYGAPIYVWYRIIDGNGGVFTYQVDGGAATTVIASTSPPINTSNGGNQGVGLVRITGVAAGSHTILVTVTSATNAGNVVSVLGVGTPAAYPTYGSPKLFVGGVIRELNDQRSAATVEYNADVAANVALLQGDGLNVYFVPTRNYVNSTSDMYDTYHPNTQGYQHLKDAFESVMQFTPGAMVNGTFTTLNLNVTKGTYELNGTSFGQASTTLGDYFVAGAGNGAVTGSANTGVGYNSLQNVTTGSSNTTNGYFALLNDTTGSANTVTGGYASELNTTGSGNVANGVEALLHNTTGSNNVGVGELAGVTLLSGSYDTFLGYGTNVTTSASTTLTNSTAIGYGATVSTSNEVVVGSTTVTQTLLNGNVGIGTSNPGALLAVNGTASSTGLIISGLGDGLYQCLHIDGNGNVSGTSSDCGSGGGGGTPAGSSGQIQFNNSGAFAGASGLYWNSVNNSLGVGTTSPYALLSIANNLNTPANTPLFIIASTTGGTATSTLFTVSANGNSGFNTTSVTGTGSTTVQIAGVGSGVTQYGSLSLSNAGNSTNNIAGSLDYYVAGTPIGAVRGRVTSGGNVGQLEFYTANGATPNNVMAINGLGNLSVGYGTNESSVNSARVVIATSTFGVYSRALDLDNLSTGAGSGSEIGFQSLNSSSITKDFAVIRGLDISSTAGAEQGGLAFYTTNAGTSAERARINSAGDLGVGTTSPATLLEVGGTSANVTFDGYLNCSGFTTNANGLISCTASDERLKQEITPLDASSTLSALDSLNPVSFYWNPETQRGTQQQFGLIAQQVQGVFPNLVSTTSPTDLTPDGTLTVNYDGLIAPLVVAVQYLSSEISGFAQSITTAVLNATTVNTHQLCLSDESGTTCFTRSQLNSLLQQAQSGVSYGAVSPIIITNVPPADDMSTTTTGASDIDASSTPDSSPDDSTSSTDSTSTNQ